jgi:hypothetical protein
MTLGRAYLYTGDERYAKEAITQIEQWITQNPPAIGLNWHSSLEIALRALSWMWTIFLVAPSKHLNSQRIEKILRSLFAHLTHVHRFPSTYSSPNTHLAGEALALYVGGTVFSSMKHARAWREFGRTVLLDTIQKQVLEDGFHAELSAHYHCYALEFYLIALALARRVGDDFPPQALCRMEGMLDALAYIAGPDGSIPRLSDDDGGRALALGATGYKDVRSLLSTGAVLFERPDLKWGVGHIHEETLWLLGAEAYVAFERMTKRPPESHSRLFPQSGYFVSRSGWNPGDDRFVFDCGSLGFLGGGHGHADALSFSLSSGDKDLLIDPGTAVYNGAPPWRNFFRSTRAHNTVTVDGQDQAIPGGTFGWKTNFNCRIVRHLTLPDAEYIEAEHDGYSRLVNPVVHKRRVLHARAHCWVVVDDFRGEGLHCFDSFYHFAPAAAVSLDPRQSLTGFSARLAVENRGASFAFFASNAVHASIIHGSREPIQGWYSHEYGDVRAAPVLCARVQDSAPSASITVIIPRHLDLDIHTPPLLREELIEEGRGAACLLDQDGVQDLFVQSLEGGAIHVSDFAFEGDFLWARSRNGQVTEALCVNAAYAAWGNHVLFENPSPVSCVNVRITQNRATTVYADAEWSAYVRH